MRSLNKYPGAEAYLDGKGLCEADLAKAEDWAITHHNATKTERARAQVSEADRQRNFQHASHQQIKGIPRLQQNEGEPRRDTVDLNQEIEVLLGKAHVEQAARDIGLMTIEHGQTQGRSINKPNRQRRFEGFFTQPTPEATGPVLPGVTEVYTSRHGLTSIHEEPDENLRIKFEEEDAPCCVCSSLSNGYGGVRIFPNAANE